jgi:hypothetical protein
MPRPPPPPILDVSCRPGMLRSPLIVPIIRVRSLLLTLPAATPLPLARLLAAILLTGVLRTPAKPLPATQAPPLPPHDRFPRALLNAQLCSHPLPQPISCRRSSILFRSPIAQLQQTMLKFDPSKLSTRLGQFRRASKSFLIRLTLEIRKSETSENRFPRPVSILSKPLIALGWCTVQESRFALGSGCRRAESRR